MADNCKLCRIALENVSVVRGGQTLLQDVSMHIHCGQLTVLIGQNGAGKTTLIRALLGEYAHAGTIRHVDGEGRDVAHMRTGYVPQHLEFDKEMPVTVEDLQLENVRHDGLPCVIVSDGTLNEGELTRAKKDHIWLTKELKKRNIKDVKEIFVASLDAEDELFIQLKGEWRK